MRKLTIFLLLLFSCSSPKLLYIQGNINDARQNIIELLSKKYSKKRDFFSVDFNDSIPGYYVFTIEKNTRVIMKRNIIGKKSNYFPSKFIEKNERLFLWRDSTKTISKKIIDVMQKYNTLNLSLIIPSGYKKLDSLKLEAIKPKKYNSYEEMEKDKSFNDFYYLLDSLYVMNKSNQKLIDLREALIMGETKYKYYTFYVCKKNLSIIKIIKGAQIIRNFSSKHPCR